MSWGPCPCGTCPADESHRWDDKSILTPGPHRLPVVLCREKQRREVVLCETVLFNVRRHTTQLSKAHFRATVPIGDVVHQAAHQADSSAVRRDVGASLGEFRSGIGIEPWSGVDPDAATKLTE